MKYKSGSAFRRALEDRLRVQSRIGGLPLFRLRKLVAFDRLLARLNVTSPDAWVLKGGFALQLHFGLRSRTTKDIDLLMRQSASPVWDMLRQAGATELGDWFAFEVGRPRAEALGDHGGRRFPVHSLLDSRTFERFHVDVGTGDPILEPPEVLITPDLLAFAGIDPVPFPTYPLTQQIAEKLHAFTSKHEGTESTRVRDLVDLLLIASRSTFDAGKLSQPSMPHLSPVARMLYRRNCQSLHQNGALLFGDQRMNLSCPGTTSMRAPRLREASSIRSSMMVVSANGTRNLGRGDRAQVLGY